MAKTILTTPDSRLREKSKRVTAITDETHQIISDMIDLSLAWESKHPNELSAAMAAPQMGELQRIIIMRDDLGDPDNKSFTALINPEIIRTEGASKADYEGCLSVPDGIYGMISRPTRVKIKALLENGDEVRIKADDNLARTLLHEIDHLDGILFIDHIRDQEDAFYRLNDKGDLDPLDYETDIKNNPKLWEA